MSSYYTRRHDDIFPRREKKGLQTGSIFLFRKHVSPLKWRRRREQIRSADSKWIYYDIFGHVLLVVRREWQLYKVNKRNRIIPSFQSKTVLWRNENFFRSNECSTLLYIIIKRRVIKNSMVKICLNRITINNITIKLLKHFWDDLSFEEFIRDRDKTKGFRTKLKIF